MFDKISYTWSLMGASWDVLKRDKSLLLFPLMSVISCLIVIASFAVPTFAWGLYKPPAKEAGPAAQVAYYGLIFLFYFCNYFVITFFNTAIIACAISRMAGGEPTVSGGLREAFGRMHLIAGWALVSATVGLILRIIEDRSEKIGRIIAGLLGAAWSILTFLVVPVLVVENKGPFAALKDSAVLLKKTWGEQIVGNFSFGLVFFLLGIPGFALIALGFYVGAAAHSLVLLGSLIALGVVYLVILGLVQSALQSIFQAAVYLHATGMSTGGPQGFPVQLLSQAMTSK